MQDPLEFIQVIASFSLLRPEKLGFDPTIKLLVSPNQAVSSFNPNEEFVRSYQTGPHNRRWVIRMNDGSEYVTIETVSSVRAGFLRGRGSIAWVVVPFNFAKDESKVDPSFEFLNLFLNEVFFNSRFWFLSSRGVLLR